MVYARVSSHDQRVGLDRQVARVTGWVTGQGLTVAGVEKESFRIWIIPHTYEVTALRERKVGDAVDLEADLLGKYVEKFIKNASH